MNDYSLPDTAGFRDSYPQTPFVSEGNSLEFFSADEVEWDEDV